MRPKKPTPVRDAKRIALKSYSMWANYLGIAALIAPEVIYYLWQIDTNPRFWWVLGLGLILFGIVGRLIHQNITNSPLGATVGAILIAMAQVPPAGGTGVSAAHSGAMPPYSQDTFLEVAVPHIAKWEGLRTEAYLDTLAAPPVWTVCYGETKGVKQGDSYTVAECNAMLAHEVVEYQEGWHAYLTPETLHARLTPERDTAYTSLAYNVGIAGAGKSTATRRLNAGKVAGGCEALTWWNRAGQRVVRGLVRRRADEYALCMEGLA